MERRDVLKALAVLPFCAPKETQKTELKAVWVFNRELSEREIVDLFKET